MQQHLSIDLEKNRMVYYLAIMGCLIVYAGTFFFPLMDKDAAHHANIALHMLEHNNYTDLVDRGSDYLDKPHMLFWLEALSFKVFGVNTFADRLPAFLTALLAVYATGKLGSHIGGRSTGRLAAIILATGQAFVMSVMDARMETPLTAFIMLGMWQLIVYIDRRNLINLLLAALGAGLAFSTKGWIGVVVIFAAAFFYIWLNRKWSVLFSPRTWLFLPLFALFIAPVVYAYYVQYDLHPEKVIRGVGHRSGVRFILWNQLFERSQGFDQGSHGRNSDYFFLYHTFLWAFLPWSIMAYAALFFWLRRMFYQKKWRPAFGFAALAFAFILFAISFSKFKMPHYIIMLLPLAALFTAPYLRVVLMKRKFLRFYSVFQVCFALLVAALIVLLNYWAFPPNTWAMKILAPICLLVFLMLVLKRPADKAFKVVSLSVALSLVLNFFLNYNFFPQVMRYQAGNELARNMRQQRLSVPDDSIVLLESQAHSFDFYRGYNHLVIDPKDFTNAYPDLQNRYFLLSRDLKNYVEAQGFTVTPVISQPDYNVSTLKLPFLNPKTRNSTLDTLMLARISKL